MGPLQRQEWKETSRTPLFWDAAHSLTADMVIYKKNGSSESANSFLSAEIVEMGLNKANKGASEKGIK